MASYLIYFIPQHHRCNLLKFTSAFFFVSVPGSLEVMTLPPLRDGNLTTVRTGKHDATIV